MLEVLKRADGDGEMLKRAHDTIERQLGQMVRLVDDLLDLNRITHDRLELRQSEVELASVIQQAVEVARPLIDSAGHDLRIDSARGADLSERRSRAVGPGVWQPAQQQLPVHETGRNYLGRRPNGWTTR